VTSSTRTTDVADETEMSVGLGGKVERLGDVGTREPQAVAAAPAVESVTAAARSPGEHVVAGATREVLRTRPTREVFRAVAGAVRRSSSPGVAP
jgi:hypothetical protein